MRGRIWWMYSGYVCLTNAVRTTRPSGARFHARRMGAYLILALVAGHSRGVHGRRPRVGIAYTIVVGIHRRCSRDY